MFVLTLDDQSVIDLLELLSSVQNKTSKMQSLQKTVKSEILLKLNGGTQTPVSSNSFTVPLVKDGKVNLFESSGAEEIREVVLSTIDNQIEKIKEMSDDSHDDEYDSAPYPKMPMINKSKARRKK
jgi:uncharacterized spore protein YtfJ